jgi:small GTP-binding protein
MVKDQWHYSTNLMVKDQQINLQLWDTAGQKEYKKFRSCSYPQTDIFILCFSLVSQISVQNIQNMWIPELSQYCQNTPYILVGMKSDLRDVVSQNPDEFKSKGMESVSSSQGQENGKNHQSTKTY